MEKVYKYYELCSIKPAEKRYAPLYSFLNIEGRRKLFSEHQEEQFFTKKIIEKGELKGKSIIEMKKGGRKYDEDNDEDDENIATNSYNKIDSKTIIQAESNDDENRKSVEKLHQYGSGKIIIL
jgi:hypothetical protein